jgi:hypothetical protein
LRSGEVIGFERADEENTVQTEGLTRTAPAWRVRGRVVMVSVELPVMLNDMSDASV